MEEQSYSSLTIYTWRLTAWSVHEKHCSTLSIVVLGTRIKWLSPHQAARSDFCNSLLLTKSHCARPLIVSTIVRPPKSTWAVYQEPNTSRSRYGKGMNRQLTITSSRHKSRVASQKDRAALHQSVRCRRNRPVNSSCNARNRSRSNPHPTPITPSDYWKD